MDVTTQQSAAAMIYSKAYDTYGVVLRGALSSTEQHPLGTEV